MKRPLAMKFIFLDSHVAVKYYWGTILEGVIHGL